MKTAFLRLLSPIISLWRTVTKYVRKHILIRDVTGDGHKDVIIHNDTSYSEVNTSTSLSDSNEIYNKEE